MSRRIKTRVQLCICCAALALGILAASSAAAGEPDARTGPSRSVKSHHAASSRNPANAAHGGTAEHLQARRVSPPNRDIGLTERNQPHYSREAGGQVYYYNRTGELLFRDDYVHYNRPRRLYYRNGGWVLESRGSSGHYAHHVGSAHHGHAGGYGGGHYAGGGGCR